MSHVDQEQVNTSHKKLTLVNVANIVIEAKGSLSRGVLRMVGRGLGNLRLLVGVDRSHMDGVRHRRSLG